MSILKVIGLIKDIFNATQGSQQNQNTNPAQPHRPTPVAMPKKGEIQDSPKNPIILNSIEHIANECFPDNELDSWDIYSIKHEGEVSFVEAVPSPNDVGYPAFIFALVQPTESAVKLVGTYAFKNGGYQLLSRSKEAAVALPQSR